MQLSELRTYITDRYPTGATPGVLNQHINEVYLDLARLFTSDAVSEAQLVTTAGQPLYTLPVASRSTQGVRYGTGRTRLIRTQRDLASGSGTPTAWYPGGLASGGRSQIGLDPAPTVAGDPVYVAYQPSPAKMANDTDAPLWVPDEYHHVIAWGALSLTASVQGDGDVAGQWEPRYRSAYNDILTLLGLAPEQNPEAAQAVRQGGNG